MPELDVFLMKNLKNMTSVIITAYRHKKKTSSSTGYVLNTKMCAVTSFDRVSQLYIYSTQDDLFSYDHSVFQIVFSLTHMERSLKSLM